MQDEVNTKVVAIMIKGGKISAEVLKKALDIHTETKRCLRESQRIRIQSGPYRMQRRRRDS